jgi:membrane-bound lytic murein transglycosylase MltF
MKQRPRTDARFLCVILIAVLCTMASFASASVQEATPEMVATITVPWTGDLDGMVKRRTIRVLVVPSKTFYFVDRGEQRGVTYEALREFEKFVNTELNTKTLRVNVVIIPSRRDQLMPFLEEGRADIAAANLTITPERLKSVDFSDPAASGVSELVVTGPSAPHLSTLDDLAGNEIHVRKSSSYYESLVRLNERFKKAGKEPMQLVPADELLEDEDLLEMVNTGLIPMIVVDSHKAEFWAQVFDAITVRSDLAVNTGGEIAWALRRSTPQLMALVNEFIKKHKKGTLLGNILLNRYLKDASYVKNSVSDQEMKKFWETIQFFQKYAGQYGFDWLMVAAQAYQESQLDQSKRSHAGAVGVMQVLPSTAADPNVNINDIEKLEPNIQAGIKYMRFILDQYFKDAPMDDLNKNLFAFASYNAGPARVRGLRKKAADAGLDPNVWFRNVEVMAAREIGRETVQYVSNIFKYYIAYHLVVDRMKAKDDAKKRTIGK